MSMLRQLQHEFQDFILRGHDTVTRRIVGDERVTASERLEVYSQAYRLRLLEALESDFVALRAWVGPELFTTIGTAYIDAHPSYHYSLRHFGRHLSEFLNTTAFHVESNPGGDPTPGLLTELAAFDWALIEAFDAADSALVTVADMAGIEPTAWANLQFAPHASLRRLNLNWNAPAIWKAADTGELLPPAQRADPPTLWVIWRQNFNSYFRSLNVDEACALDALMRGESFGAICEDLCEWIDPQNVAAHAAGMLKQWIVDEMIREIKLGR